MKSVREQRSWITDPAILSSYLPEAVATQLHAEVSAGRSAADLNQYVARLHDLLRIVVAFVPDYAELAHKALPAAEPGLLHTTEGSLLAADLSGFTAFSAQLSTLGSEGAELVAQTINSLFSALLGSLEQWNGRLLKLSGDALTALFTGDDHAHRAVTAALALQDRMAAFASLATPAGEFTLRIRIGVASGAVLLAQVGTPQRIELLVAGAAAREVIDYQRHASPGAVVVGSTTYSAIQARGPQAIPIGPGRYRVVAIAPATPPAPAAPFTWVVRDEPLWELYALIARIEALRPYLLAQHLTRLADGPPALAGEGELRPVTILFANLSDADELLARAATGERPDAMAALQARVRQIWEIVAQHGGTINKLDLHPDGHTLVVLFGAPIAQSRDAERAVGCALALTQALGAPAPALQVRRVGVASGRVFAGAVGSPERREYTVMGSVVNLAARLMDTAEPGQVLLDVATAQAAEHRFQLQAQPPVPIKGYPEPVPYFTLALEQGPRLNLLTRAQGALVGRDAELERARAVIERALGGHGGVVALVGEAGMGKSRLLSELVHGALLRPARAVTLVIAQSQPAHQARPYHLLVDLLRQLYDLPERPEVAARFLAEQASRELPKQQRFLPLLPTLFGLPGDDSPITHALTPDERRARLQDLAVALMRRRAGAEPAAFVLEDLHWADNASLAILGALASAGAGQPLLLLCTYRPEGAPAWPAGTASTIALDALAPAQAEQLIGDRLGGRELAPALRAAIIERTQGNPFFIEETARALGEHHITTVDAPPLPTSIQGALIARFDRLPLAERYLLQLAAVIGPQFDRPLLAGIAGGQAPLGPALAQLAERGIVRALGEQQYRFAHSLTQETIYESMLFAQRRDVHRRIANHLRDHQPERADADPGLLAMHYRRAEAWPEALDYAWSAGARAQALYASDIALTHYQHALDAAARLDPLTAAQSRPPILRRIGDLHALAGRFGEATAAYADALATSADAHERAEILICWTEICEGQANYDEALSRLEQAGAGLGPDDTALALRIAVRRGWVLVRSGAPEAARTAVAPCLEPLEAIEGWGDLLLAYKVFFHIAMGQSRWSEARSYLRLAIRMAERTGDLREIGRLRNNMGIVLTQEGNLRAAAGECERAATILNDIGDQHTLASVEVNIGAIHYKIGDFGAARAHYLASLRSAKAIGALPLESIVYSNLGELYRRLGRLPASLVRLRRSIALCAAMQDDLGLSEAQRQLAETFILMDRLAEAEEACARALEHAFAANDAQAEAIAYRVRGMLARARGDYDLALADSQRSVQTLAELGSTPELAQSLAAQADIWMNAGRADLAEAVLEEAMALFQQAGAAADLAQASDLLGQLHAGEYEAKAQL